MPDLDFHVLIRLGGQTFVANYQGVQGFNTTTTYYDVVMSMTQQGNEFLEEFCNRMEAEGRSADEIEQLARQWAVLDSETKAWIQARYHPEKIVETFERIVFEELLVKWQNFVMLSNRGAIGDTLDFCKVAPPERPDTMTWFLEASESELKDALEYYREKAWDIHQRQAQFELDKRAYKDGEWSGEKTKAHWELTQEFVRMAGFIWTCRRRLGEV